MVAGSDVAGSSGVLRKRAGGKGGAVGAVGDSVCGLCVVAEGMAGRKPDSEAAELLAGTVEWDRADVAADGPAVPGGPKRGRESIPVGDKRGVEPPAEAAEPAPGDDAVHDAAGRFAGVAVALQRAEGSGGGDGDRQPESKRSGAVDRILRQHGVAARRGEKRATIRATAGAG